MTNRTPIRRDLTELLTLAWPVVLSRLGFMTMGLIDTVVVGQFSTPQLAYNSLAWVVTGAVLTGGMGLLSGVQVMTARRIGEGRPQATGGVLRRGALYALWVSVLAAAVSIIGGPPLLLALKLEPDLAIGAGRVLIVLSLSLPLILVSAAASGFLEGLARPRVVMFATWGGNIANLVFDLVLVPGGFGIPAMGAVGAAWGTFGARLLMLVWLYIYIVRMKDARTLGVFHAPIDGAGAAREQRRIGYGGGVTMFVEGASFSAMTIVAGWLGGLAVAAWAILLNLAALIFMVPLGVGTATAVLVGRAYGAKDGAGVRRFGMLGFGTAAALLTLIALAVTGVAPFIAHAYTPDKALIPMVTAGLALCSLFYVADGLQVVGAQALRAQSDVWIPTTTHTISYIVVMCPLSWFLAVRLGWGLDGVIWAVIVASLLAAGFLMTRFWWVARKV
jgi:MATE family multidrug resistance protein